MRGVVCMCVVYDCCEMKCVVVVDDNFVIGFWYDCVLLWCDV